MLRRLSVSNYILIDSLEIEFDPRLNIITGETGAGKSILLGALGLLLGNKNEGAALRDTQRNCVIEGVFDIAAYGLRPFFEANDLDYADEAVVRRILTPAGKSRAYINDLPVQLTQLREFGSRLIDIHSQHQNLILASEEFRTEALDTVAGNGELRAAYRAKYERLQELQRTCARLRAEADAARRDEEWLRYQSEELTAARLRAGEVAELEAEQAVLANADRIGEAITAVRNAFDGDEIGVLAQVKNAEVEIGRLGGSYPHAADLSRRLRSVLEELKDIAATLAEDGERIETNPERLQKVDDRLNTLYTLCQKHRAADEGELIALRDRYAAQLDAITHSDEELAALQAEIGAARNEAELLASELHRTREQAAPAFAGQIVATLVRLGMPDARFEAAVVDCGALTEGGRDRVEFRFSPPRTPPPPHPHPAPPPPRTQRTARRAAACHAGTQSAAGAADAAADHSLRRDRHGRFGAHRRRDGRDHLRAGRNDAGRRHHPLAAGRLEGVDALRGLQTRRRDAYRPPDSRRTDDRDRQDAFGQRSHRGSDDAGAHSARREIIPVGRSGLCKVEA